MRTRQLLLLLLIPVAASAATMQSGACGAGTAPSNALGSNGDLYHCTDTLRLYGPKAAGSWGTAYSITLATADCSTVFHWDHDCDGYGNGPTNANAQTPDPNPLFAKDADDHDATVFDATTTLAKWTTINGWLTHLGYPTGSVFYIATTGNNANTCTVASPCATLAATTITTAMNTKGGGTIVFRSGTYTQLLVGGVVPLASQSSSPYVVIAYPGEQPIIQGDFPLDPTSGSNENTLNFVVDGFTLTPTTYRGNDCIFGSRTVNFTVKNMEFAGCYHAWEIGGGALNSVIQDSVLYDSVTHQIYTTETAINTTGGTLDCSGWVWNTQTSPNNQHYGMVIRRNIFMNSGGSGFDAIHLNANVCGALVDSNIAWGTAGAVSNPQSAGNHIWYSNNLFFSNAAATFTANMYGCENNGLWPDPGQIGTQCSSGSVSIGTDYDPGNITDNHYINNTVWTGPLSPPTNPNAGGSNVPTDIFYLSDSSEGIAGGGVGTRFLSGLAMQNNALDYYDAGGSSAHYVFRFGPNSRPDSYTIQNNGFWNMFTGNSSANVARFWATADAANWSLQNSGFATGLLAARSSGSALEADGTILSFAGFGTYNAATNTNNIDADPTFVDAQTSYQSTPSKFDFHLAAGSTYKTAALLSAAPNWDILGYARSGTTPSIGAIEFGGTTAQTQFTLTTSTSGAGVGFITSNTGHGRCITDSYYTGETVTCLAVPERGSTFGTFTGTGSAAACATTNPCTFTITATTTLSASFTSGGAVGFTNAVSCSPSTIPVGGVAKCIHEVTFPSTSNGHGDMTNVNAASWASSNTAVATVHVYAGTISTMVYITGIAPGTVTISHPTSYTGLTGSTSLTVVANGYRQTLSTGNVAGVLAGNGAGCNNYFASGTSSVCIASPANYTSTGSISTFTDTCGGTITDGPGTTGKSKTDTVTMPANSCSESLVSTGSAAGRTITLNVVGLGWVFGPNCNPGTNTIPSGVSYYCLGIPLSGATGPTWTDTCGGTITGGVEDYGVPNVSSCTLTATFTGGVTYRGAHGGGVSMGGAVVH